MPGKKPVKTIAKLKPSPRPSAASRVAVKRSPKASPSTRPKAATTPLPAAPAPVASPPSSSLALRPDSKQAQLLSLLQGGATMAQMTQLTGWQAHTIRATISVVFRKRLGLNIEPSSGEDKAARLYRVTAAASA